MTEVKNVAKTEAKLYHKTLRISVFASRFADVLIFYAIRTYCEYPNYTNDIRSPCANHILLKSQIRNETLGRLISEAPLPIH